MQETQSRMHCDFTFSSGFIFVTLASLASFFHAGSLNSLGKSGACLTSCTLEIEREKDKDKEMKKKKEKE